MNDFTHMGQPVNFAKLLHHYRHMARMDRKSAAFWNQRARVIIAARREQLSGWREAA